jgi:leader peptidase (prepilin peptidase)/N-methyltransferase
MNSFPAAVASTSIAWLAVLTVETDFINYKIPREACWTVFVIGTLAGFLAWDIYSAIYAFIAFIVLGGVTTLVALITKGGLGSGDVRFLIAVSPLAWWIGVVPLLMGIILGCVIQAGIKLAIMMRKGNARELPFGPALAIGISIWVIAAISLSDGCINHAGVLGCG